MNNTTVLITGGNAGITNGLQSVINNPEWETIVTTSDEEAIGLFHQRPVDVVVLTQEPGSAANSKLRRIFTYQSPDIILLQYDPVHNNSLTGQIAEQLDKRNSSLKNSFLVNDDIFKGFHAS